MSRLHARRCPPPAGFTLIEILLSVAITAMLMGTMVVSLGVASRAVDPGTGPTAQTRQAAGIIEEINADLALTLSFSERTASAVTFTVPDRTGEGSPETIRYSWTGPDDGQLQRRINNGPTVTIARDVQHFSLAYQLKTVAPDTSDDDRGGKGKGGKGRGGK